MPDIKDPDSWPRDFKPVFTDDQRCPFCGAELVRPEKQSPYCPRCATKGLLVQPGRDGTGIGNLKAIRGTRPLEEDDDAPDR